MKPLPAPSVPGDTDLDRFTNAMRIIVGAPKELVIAEEKRLKQGAKKKAKR